MDQQLLCDQIVNLYSKIEELTKERDELQNTLNSIVKFTNVQLKDKPQSVLMDLYEITNDHYHSGVIEEYLKNDDIKAANGVIQLGTFAESVKDKLLEYCHKYRIKNKSQSTRDRIKYSENKLHELQFKISNKGKTYSFTVD